MILLPGVFVDVSDCAESGMQLQENERGNGPIQSPRVRVGKRKPRSVDRSEPRCTDGEEREQRRLWSEARGGVDVNSTCARPGTDDDIPTDGFVVLRRCVRVVREIY